MVKANLKIILCSFLSKYDLFEEFILNDKTYKIEDGKVDIPIMFDEYEEDLGKKICRYKLFDKDKKDIFSGSFEINEGDIVGYFFVDFSGTTFDLSFINRKGPIQKLIEQKFTASYSKTSTIIDLKLNPNKTKDRANLLLINFNPYIWLNMNGDKFFNLWTLAAGIDNFSMDESYSLCFQNDDFKNFGYRKVTELSKLNFEEIYQQNHKIVDELYENVIKIMGDKKNFIQQFRNLYDDRKNDLEDIILEKYVYGPKILEKQFKDEKYIDFIYKIILFKSINSMIVSENYPIDDLEKLFQNLLLNKNNILKDKQLSIHEKIFLLMDIDYLQIILDEDPNIKYINMKTIEKNSPLYYAKIFLEDFINELDYDSPFYFPLLSIDSDKFFGRIKTLYEFVTTYGFSMLSIDKLKEHLKNMIPNIITITNILDKDTESITNYLNGSVILNANLFQEIDIGKSCENLKLSKHYGFIIAKLLLHEAFGHKKSTYSDSAKIIDSIISFKDEDDKFVFVSRDDKDIYKKLDDIEKIKEIDSFIGDSGLFIEYHFGYIDENPVLSIIDVLEKKTKTNLNKLLDANMWHKNLKTMQDYLKLKCFALKFYPNIEVNEDLNIQQEIELINKKAKEDGLDINNFELKLSEYVTDNDNIYEASDKKKLKKRKNIIVEKIQNNKSASKNNNQKKANDNLSKRERECYKKYFKK